MELYDALHQGKAETETAIGAMEGHLGLYEWLENARQELRGDPAAVILDSD